MEKPEMTSMLVRLPVYLKQQLDSIAVEKDLSTAQLVRSLIKTYVDKNFQGDLFMADKKSKRK